MVAGPIRSGRPPTSAELLDAEARIAGATVLVAEDDGRAIGTATATQAPSHLANIARAGGTRKTMRNENTHDRYYAAACQIDLPNPKTRDEIPERVTHMLNLVDYAVTGYEPFFDVRLVVFPEFAHAAPIYTTVEQLLERLAVPIPNEHTDRYVAKARSLGVYIQTGTFLESDSRWPGHVFNTTCLIGPEGILLKYRKVHTWVPWEVHTSPHDLPGYDEPLFPVAATPIGRLGVAICYDWLFPEAIRQLALQGAEVLIRVSAYMDPWGTAAPTDWWTLINRVRAWKTCVT